MENTLENKAKFFAQYYGQEILKWHDKGILLEIIWSDLKNDLKINHFLDLKPLSSITDEDQNHVLSNPIANSMGLVIKQKIGAFYESDIYVTDYLRSKGYALPYMGLSVETMVEYGWIKVD